MRELVPARSVLPADHHSLALGVPAGAAPGTLHVLALTGGITVRPREGRTVLFGRNRSDVHVCVGENDRRVSRQQGILTHLDDQWWVRTTGKLPLRLPRSRLLFNQDDPIPLPAGYTPLFVRGSSGREHLVEVHVQAEAGDGPAVGPEDVTQPPNVWPLSPTERLVLVVLGQRYLLHELYPNPLSWRQVAEHLNEISPDQHWSGKSVEHIVLAVRARLSRGGVAGLTRDEVGEPVGNTLNHNLVHELMVTTTLVPPDLRLIGYDGEPTR